MVAPPHEEDRFGSVLNDSVCTQEFAMQTMHIQVASDWGGGDLGML